MTERRLQYNYAHVKPDTGECDSCGTFSYEINHPEWIAVPHSSNAYIGKYYLDGAWYEDADGTIPWEP